MSVFPSRLRPLVCALALASATLSAPTWAASNTQPFHIPAGSLEQSLTRLARDAQISLVFNPAVLKGRQAPALSGELSVDAALAQLLAGSGYAAIRSSDGSYALQLDLVAMLPAVEVTGIKPLAVVASAGDVTLPAVEVEAASAPETATGPVRGFVATRSATATKTDTPIIETPQSISVVTRDEMTARNPSNVTEALRYTSGIVTEQYGSDFRGPDWIGARGFTIWHQYLDGLRLFNYSFIETYGMERVEFLKGPSSVLYGQSGVAGVVNNVSKLPSADHLNEVVLETGSFQRKQAQFDIGGVLNDDGSVLYRVVGLKRDSDTGSCYGHGNDECINNDRDYLAPSITWKISADTDFTLQADYLKQQAGRDASMPTPDGEPSSIIVADPNHNRSRYAISNLGYQFNHAFNEATQFRHKLRYTQRSDLFETMYHRGYEDDQRTMRRVARSSTAESSNLMTDNQLETVFTTANIRHQLLLGVDYAQNRTDEVAQQDSSLGLDFYLPQYGITIPKSTPPFWDTLQKQKQIGVYAQDQMRFEQPWVVTVGLRQDWVRNTTTDRLDSALSTESKDAALSGRVGVNYVFANGIAPYASYSTSFEPNEGRNANGGALVPTEGKQFELGVKYQAEASKTLLTAAIFDIRQQNVKTAAPFDSSLYVQTGEVGSRGLELEAKSHLTQSLGLTASYAYTDIEVLSSNEGTIGKMPSLTPNHVASLWADYTLIGGTLNGLGLAGGVRYKGATWGDADNSIRNKALTVFDLAVRYEMSHWRLALNIDNVTDERQAVNEYGAYYWNPERTVRVNAAYHW